MTWRNVPNPWSKTSSTKDKNGAEAHLAQAKSSLQALLEDKGLNQDARARLAEEYQQLQRHLDKLERGDVHVSVFGRVSVGKSALLNALLGEKIFRTSVLHGETKNSASALWQQYDSGGVHLIDTPGIDEMNGAERAQIAEQVASRADVILFVIDGDMTLVEYEALQALSQEKRLLLLVLNKCDRFHPDELNRLLAHLEQMTEKRFPIVPASAAPEAYLEIRDGREHWVRPEADVTLLRETLWQMLKEQGQSYAALNASIFAAQLATQVGLEIVAARRSLAEQIIHKYALTKALGVAINPVPAADLLALAADASMVWHLSKVYGIACTMNEASQLLRQIALQTGLLMATVFGVHVLSSSLKALTGGLSTVITAGAQGGVAFYGSYVIGKAAETYFAQGASWGEYGAKQTIQNIIADLDKEALLEEAKQAMKRFKSP